MAGRREVGRETTRGLQKCWPIQLIGILVILAVIKESLQKRVTSFSSTEFSLSFPSAIFIDVQADAAFYKAMFCSVKNSTARLTVVRMDTYKEERTLEVKLPSELLYFGLFNSGNIGLLCKNHVVVASAADGYSSAILPQPSEFIKKNTMEKMRIFNDFNQTLLMVYNKNQLAELDVRRQYKAEVNKIITDYSSSTSLVDIKYINSGRHIAIALNQSNIEELNIYQQSNRQLIATLKKKVDDVRMMSYNSDLNLLTLLIYSQKTFVLMDCTPKKKWKIVGEINFSLDDLDPHEIEFLDSPAGTSILMALTQTSVFFYDLKGKKFIDKHNFEVSQSKRIFWAEGSNTFMVQENKTIDNIPKENFKMFTLHTKDSRFCHKSCGSTCKRPFVACFNSFSIVSSFFIGAALVLLLWGVLWQAFKYFARKSSDAAIMDDEGNEYEFTNQGGMRKKRNTISLDDKQSLGLPLD